eukprot:jgi/Bigna1/142282/aug1.68_g16990
MCSDQFKDVREGVLTEMDPDKKFDGTKTASKVPPVIRDEKKCATKPSKSKRKLEDLHMELMMMKRYKLARSMANENADDPTAQEMLERSMADLKSITCRC